MESRLPKPKIQLANSINHTTSINLNMNNQKVTKNQRTVPSSSNGISETLKKAKSTLNINSKSTIENKPPPKQNLTRAKTMSSITTRAIKRPATGTVMHTEAKKLFTRPNITRPTTMQKTNAALTSNITTRSTQNATATKPQNATVAKFPKWDLKKRLAHTSEELSNLRQKYKEITSKFNTLQDQLNSLETNTNTYKVKAVEYENLNKVLDTELKELKINMCSIQEEKEDLTKRLKESEESFKNVSNSLKEFKEKCTSQEELILKQTSAIRDLQTSLEDEKLINEELTSVKHDLQSLIHTMDKDRRTLHNAIQELKGNIRVFCRVRPRTPTELGKVMCTMNFIDESTIEVSKYDGSDSVSCSGKQRGTRQEFSFDKVFPPTAKQEDIFEELALLVQSALEGYNVCVFAYGQTGSGKTYTMEGLPGFDTEGMIPRTVRHIFQEMKQFQLLGWEYKIEASFLEIYNEHIVDLLDSQPKTHEIRMADSKGHDLYVSNLKIEEIHSPEELHKCLLTAQRNRAVAATQSNERSSRSHSVARIKLIGTHKTKEEISIGNLNLVDLAGSERLKGEESVRLAETKNINKSLANLGNVILALLKKQEHVPYRNSKLTHLLMPSLGGNSKTLMLLNVSPLDECYNETLNSLRFASNVNNCKTGNVKRTRTVLQNSS
ncbi:PREDICTED: protein claret segregational-like isoform X2 [Dufourea novaeangliae]|uniref:Protein claret segregational n=2 Tax=Dufourea novaeangliae TaxID=178035 RepID=A0A154PQN6_DUFNO|nr:PREDICTED: protein claret segregational-like isoform X2 [Dufourea novaeangliae]XP_015437036.1 PREDICTED: protein claret segregational-like isoform X2 [Dufourea novaeangliae]KZC14236.1 Protein claret segregational [Dufourea novaeangliae]